MQRRNTNQMQIVVEALEYLGHASTEKLIRYIQEKDSNISLASIYRNITKLLDEKKIKRVKLAEEDVLETVKEVHSHFVCEKCKEIIDVNFDNDKLLQFISIDSFTVKKCELAIYGICDKCKE